MPIDWRQIYDTNEEVGKKFERLIKPIPWTDSYEQNVADTLEWLVRSGRGRDVRYNPEPITNLVVDDWYRYEPLDGTFFHTCYPRDMLNFRQQYDSLHVNMMASRDIAGATQRAKFGQRKLWNAFFCIGADGHKRANTKAINGEVITPSEDELIFASDFDDYASPRYNQHWENKCSRCQIPLPKQLQAWIVLMIRLRDIKS